MRDELLNAEIFNTTQEAAVLIERWRAYYNDHIAHLITGLLNQSLRWLISV